MTTSPVAAATDVLNRAGAYLDDGLWDKWLALYRDDAVYRVPAWRDESTETTDPDREISQIYHTSRDALAERVARVRSGLSVTTMPLPRTTHFTSNVTAAADGGSITARASWMVQAYQPRTANQTVNFGHYELRLESTDDRWLIAEHVIHLKNDLVPALLDFYLL